MQFSFSTGQMLLRTMLIIYLLFLQLNNFYGVFCTKQKRIPYIGGMSVHLSMT
jgi:hypothetical protein